MVFELMDDRTDRAKVTVVCSDFGYLFESSFWPEMVLQRCHNVASADRLRLVLQARFRLVRQWSRSKAKAGWTAIVGSSLAGLAEQFHFWLPLSFPSTLETGRSCRTSTAAGFARAGAATGLA